MNNSEKTIAELGLSDADARNALFVTYKGKPYVFYTDGAGLDYFDFNDFKLNQDDGHELFCGTVDYYRTIGLAQALTNAGAIVTPRKVVKAGN